jgi:hypothetical protein
MRNGRIGLVSAMVLVSTVAVFGCSSSSGDGGTGGKGGSSSSTGGSVGTGGSSTGGAGGEVNMGGAAGTNSAVTTLSGTKTVGTLTTAEASQLCNDVYMYFGTAIPNATACKWKGLSYAASSSAPTQAMLQQNCTTQQSSCGIDPWANNAGCSDLPAGCTATVAEYSACIKDTVVAFIQTVNGLPMCSALTSADTAKIFDAQAGAGSPASCDTLANKCPDLTAPSPLNQ